MSEQETYSHRQIVDALRRLGGGKVGTDYARASKSGLTAFGIGKYGKVAFIEALVADDDPFVRTEVVPEPAVEPPAVPEKVEEPAAYVDPKPVVRLEEAFATILKALEGRSVTEDVEAIARRVCREEARTIVIEVMSEMLRGVVKE